MATTDYMDDDMRELMDCMSKAITPKSKRKSVFRTSWHTPYYRDSRYRKVV